MALDYVRDPAEIYRRSFAEIAAVEGLAGLDDGMRAVATRVIHACGMTDIVDDLRSSTDAVAAGREALQAGAPIFCDVEMVRAGIIRRNLPAGSAPLCDVGSPEAAELAARHGTTRSAAQIDLWGARLDGAIVVIGNAPTALFRLLEAVDEGVARPALVLGFPVGFVGAAESKAELAVNPRGLSYVTLMGRRGGSAMASAAMNAVAAGLDP